MADGPAEPNPARSWPPLVGARIVAPPLPRSYCERPRLLERLDASLHDATSLTLISAPAGYGKTVAVRGWLVARNMPAAWLTLDPADDDVVRFVRDLLAALRPVRPEATSRALDLLSAGAAPDIERIGATILEDIAASDGRFALVLDDYHALEAEPVQALVRLLVAHRPPFMHPIVLTREDPPLPLGRLRGHRRLTELRATDLRYSVDDASAFLLGPMGIELVTEQVERLVDQSEGWVVGLQLAAMSWQASGERGHPVDAAGHGRRAIFDYLAGEVTSGLDPELRRFLTSVSVADDLTPETCACLTGRNDAPQLLAEAERRNLFLTAADPARSTFRLHQLFREHLRSLLEDDERRRLHERLARFLQREGRRQEAIAHALDAGSLDLAVELLEHEARPTFESGELSSLLGWLGRLPPDRLAASDELVSIQAWVLVFTGRVGEGAAIAGRWLVDGSSGTGPARGRLLALQSLIAAVTGPAPGQGPSAAELARSALDLLDGDDFFRAITLLTTGMAAWSGGDPGAGLRLWQEAMAAARRCGQPTTLVLAAAALSGGLNDVGRRAEAEALCRATLAEFADARGRTSPIAWLVRMALGLLRYEANDLVEARRQLERGYETAGSLGFSGAMVVWAIEYLALVRQATGSPREALDAVLATSRGLRAAGMVLPSQNAEIEARIRLLQGDAAAAGLWADQARPDVPDGSPMLGQIVADQDLAVSRVRLWQGRPEEALRLLRPVRARAERIGLVADLVTISVLEAGAAEMLGRRAAALRCLEAALANAAGGHVRRLIDDGRHVAALLPLVRKTAPALVDEVLAGLRGEGGAPALAEVVDAAVARERLLESLTERELDVLGLMARGASDAEVARTLVISLATAKWHAANVRAKLGVRSRVQAVLRAQQLDLCRP